MRARLSRRLASVASKVTSVDKRQRAGDVPHVARDRAPRRTTRNTPRLQLEDLLVDNTAMQLINRPADFDVVVTENMFGDILSDEAAQITGSLGHACQR